MLGREGLSPKGGLSMKMTLLGLAVLAAGVMAQPAHADPYRWCAEYGGGRGGGGTNCGFVTWQQCQAAISGVGGFCRKNAFYTGPERRRGRSAYGMERQFR
jgi:hypothetical protein